MRPILFVFSGLPASGKSTLAQRIASKFVAVYLRIDTIEQGLRDLCNIDVEGEGYRMAYRIASDNLKLGLNVIADCCNPIALTRNEWKHIAQNTNSFLINIEVVCSDKEEHQKRVFNRISEIENLKLPNWESILEYHYENWTGNRIQIDTSHKTIEDCVSELFSKIELILENN
ncbi:adenylyl-sulfate kinase [Capnocytophaga stomatis]|uniref:AAA family ATPase n=1 Tax=Capnocytophaga stomatis TaxID=1848904 RepID=UPI00194DC799|nr:AAA family ATPase [Capnocytophaga stomatis]GIJ97272.1 adenylyl-sulfate kinase [Capnocytophaga stomatis]GIM50902.1 adenylyl-sulfate kinase [Capnocytophaga stomatis]